MSKENNSKTKKSNNIKKKLSDEDERRYKKLFVQLDSDKSGTISLKELTAALKYRLPDSQDFTKNVMAKEGFGENQPMTFDDFVKYIRQHENRLKKTFQKIDVNNDGNLDVEEITKAMKELGISISYRDAKNMVSKMDHSGDGYICFTEWRDFLLFSGSADLRSIYQFWNRSRTYQVGSLNSLPVEFTQEEQENGVKWKTLSAGIISSIISMTCTAPFERVELTMQTKGGHLQSTAANLYRTGGLRSIFQGNYVNCLRVLPGSLIKYSIYESIKHEMLGKQVREPSFVERLIAGGLSSCASEFIIYPMEVVKTRMTLRKPGDYKSIIDCCKKMHAEYGGIRTFYRGNLLNLLYITPYTVVDMHVYSSVRDIYMNSYHDPFELSPPITVTLTGAAVASAFAQFITYPFILVRTQLQARNAVANTVGEVSKIVYAKYGLRGFYYGIGANLLKVIPQACIGYGVFESIKGNFWGIRG